MPLAVSAFDVSRLTTRVVKEGSIASALRATCTFPGLFAPAWHEQGVLVDGGIRDTTGASLTIAQRSREGVRAVLAGLTSSVESELATFSFPCVYAFDA